MPFTFEMPSYLSQIVGSPVFSSPVFHLTSNKVLIGRDPQTQLCISDPNVSRKHCGLKNSENGWLIKDLKSVNGTYVDGKKLDPQLSYLLKDGCEIYLGPPADAPVAFAFTMFKKPKEHSCNGYDCSFDHDEEASRSPVRAITENYKCVKRPSDTEASSVNERSTRRKRIATDSSIPTTSSVNERSTCRKRIATDSSIPTTSSAQNRDFFDEIEDDGNLSNCSISSLDSLRTRLRKMSAKKMKTRIERNKETIAADSPSASPQLRSSRKANFESKPSTSAASFEMHDKKEIKLQKTAISKEFELLNEIFSESEGSNPETIKENSQSLLNDSKILIESEPYPFSQALPTETEQNKKTHTEPEKNDSLEEQLKKATLEVQKLKKDKFYLSQLVKELKSEEFLKTRYQSELQKMLEDELMCNICTEVLIKAVTLSCSHTFCEHCITEWKKKQRKCPICREKITSETKVLVLDGFINKAVEHLDVETQNKRNEVLASREKVKAAKPKKKKRSRGRGRRIRSDSSDADEIIHVRGEASNGIGVQIRFSGNTSPSIQVLQDNELVNLADDLSDESDMSVEGMGYFGGYGRCYNCGRRGHYAIGCPYS